MNPNAAVLQSYPLTVKHYRLIQSKEKKGAWFIRTDEGDKVLKRSPSSPGYLRFQCEAVRHLRVNGAPIPNLVRTRDGSDFAQADGVCYTLFDAVQGRPPEYDSPTELRQIMRTLGRFHLASRGFKGTWDGKEHNQLGGWEKDYRNQLDQLVTFKQEAERRSSFLDGIFLKHADDFASQGREALGLVQGEAYRRWVAKVGKQANLCHQDFASGNLILNSQGLYIIDMDSLAFELPARDLRKIFNKVMKKHGWSEKRTIAMLRDYHAVHPLTEDEYGVLKADLLFPHLFYGISSKYYQRRVESGWTQRKLIEKMNAMIRSETSKMGVLNRWDAIIRQVTT